MKLAVFETERFRRNFAFLVAAFILLVLVVIAFVSLSLNSIAKDKNSSSQIELKLQGSEENLILSGNPGEKIEIPITLTTNEIVAKGELRVFDVGTSPEGGDIFIEGTNRSVWVQGKRGPVEIGGSVVLSERYFFAIPEDAEPGEYSVGVGVVDDKGHTSIKKITVIVPGSPNREVGLNGVEIRRLEKDTKSLVSLVANRGNVPEEVDLTFYGIDTEGNETKIRSFKSLKVNEHSVMEFSLPLTSKEYKFESLKVSLTGFNGTKEMLLSLKEVGG